MTNDEIDWFTFYEQQKEQKKLEIYAKQRPLPRPDTKKITVFLWLLTYLILSFIVSFAIVCIFKMTNYCWLVYLFTYILFGLLFLKKICIKMIECYQHYAKEETRRRCVCIPSCSEYSLAVLRKYNVFKALNKIRIRLFVTCNDYIYKRDDP